MRNAREFVEEYRRKGYPDDRIRIIASMRPEPLRSEVVEILDQEAGTPAAVAVETAPQEITLVADEVNASGEGAKVDPPAQDPPADAQAHGDAALDAVRAELASVRSEREEIAAQLKKNHADLKKLRAEHADAKKGSADAEAAHKELEETRSQRQALFAVKSDLEGRLTNLEGALGEKDLLLVKKDELLQGLEASLKREQDRRETADARVAEMAATIDSQNARLDEIAELTARLEKAGESVEKLRSEAGQLRESERSRAKRIGEMEAEVAAARGSGEELRRQIETNELALTDLQRKLTSRESELESLRSHFDKEALDLRKRAEQEMWLVQRRLRRLRTLAGVSACIAGCLLVWALIGAIDNAGTVANQGRRIADQDRQVADLTAKLAAVTAPRQDASGVAVRDARAGDRTVSVAHGGVAPDNQGPAVLSIPINRTTTTTMPPSRPLAKSRVVTHTVKPGDTLSSISERYLGSANRYKEIARDNNLSANDARNLKVGTTLKITVPAER